MNNEAFGPFRRVSFALQKKPLFSFPFFVQIQSKGFVLILMCCAEITSVTLKRRKNIFFC